MAKHYVVWVGREPGIYSSWPDCNRQIVGFKGAKFKSYTDYEKALEAFNNPETHQPGNTAAFESFRNATMEELLAGFPYAVFCDGGCYPNPGPSGTGMVIYADGVFQQGFYGCHEPQGTNNTAELYGLLQALDFVDFLVCDQGFTEKVVIHCDSQYTLNSVANWGFTWAKNGWRKGNDAPIQNVTMIRCAHEAYKQLMDHVVLRHVKGHAGIEGNEFADQLATRARESREKGWVSVSETELCA